MSSNNIRNFSIIAHIDHGKSTLADRMLEHTATIEKRKMKEQVLDSMELERERGITIKMQPVRMTYRDHSSGETYILNLIDTPGHIDFSYEVSRALKAVEGVLLLVDATQGVQAQTLSVLDMARAENLIIIPVINKIDLPSAAIDKVIEEVVELLGCDPADIIKVSGKTGAGVPELFEAIMRGIPAPAQVASVPTRALVFDFEYSTHRGVIVYTRVFDGSLKKGDSITFAASGEKFTILEVGTFAPFKTPVETIKAGEIGYVVTGIKQAGGTKVGDTLMGTKEPVTAIPGYMTPSPVVWASIYPEGQDDFSLLRQALLRLQLEDSSLSFEEEASGSLGRGFRCGFLGMLHLEIISERLKREFNLQLIIATPTISYDIKDDKTGETDTVYTPHLFPEDLKNKEVRETWVSVKLILPTDYLNSLMPILHDHEGEIRDMENFGDKRATLTISMPLRELMRNFFDELKSATSGFASFSYERVDKRLADVARLDILINSEVIPAFSRVIARRRVQTEAEEAVNKLKNLLPRQLITIKIQAQALGRILASRTIAALRKDVTDYLYGGDITRKMKLREKQKKGKKKMQQLGKVNIPQQVFLKMMKSAE
ncbi:MAG: elongation factor 4 [Candidatus Vogelbacteria bacterium RIFOXYD1_FULL_46_19]|uniref:Elongation factor 4 n=1 Tax=Candidatus Vogelbacteria bacterium RIFOXYD1_FULL_46_19 TaxID=1802439 RepID=A0A1G2QHN6_9BACT|nr:MAG: elongation factor 4 [Candidatus Vogelbacteria bacterium RIFOXYD1_FULL_46_19]